ncbi:MAG: hypothetical protein KJZ74_12785 [Gemmatimonadales bacterium]|nr:hypothetical protein [Gemmatimonadota bacterium]MCL4214779.1 hypothetical protein [Gemmatimonadales bacterium]
MSRRDYSFIADTDSLEALRRLRRGWAGWEMAEGEFRVRLRDGGTVRAHVDRALIESDFEVSCLVADFVPDEETLPGRDSPFTSHANEVAVFRGVTWLELRPDLGPDHSIQFSGIPGFAIPESAVAKCDFTDALAVTTEGGAIVVRLALRPGWLEMVDDPEEVQEFLALRGLA